MDLVLDHLHKDIIKKDSSETAANILMSVNTLGREFQEYPWYIIQQMFLENMEFTRLLFFTTVM